MTASAYPLLVEPLPAEDGGGFVAIETMPPVLRMVVVVIPMLWNGCIHELKSGPMASFPCR